MSRHQKVLGYYADWNPAFPPASIDYRLYTHLNHAFARLSKNGTLLTPPDIAQSRDLSSRAHAANVRVILSIGGAESGVGFAQATKTPALVAALTDQIIAASKAGGYDGVDIDWEAPTNNTERDGMNALMRALREKLPPRGLLTMAVSATDWGGQWISKDVLLPYVDWLNVMTYDFHGPWSNRSGHNAPIDYDASGPNAESRASTISASADYWMKKKGWPKDRLLLGIPLYARGFRTAKWGDAAKGDYARSEVSYKDILKLQKQGWTRSWDETAKVPTLTKPDGAELISYDDAESTRIKGRFARDHGYGGIFFWEISQDFDGKTNPLVREAKAGLDS